MPIGHTALRGARKNLLVVEDLAQLTAAVSACEDVQPPVTKLHVVVSQPQIGELERRLRGINESCRFGIILYMATPEDARGVQSDHTPSHPSEPLR